MAIPEANSQPKPSPAWFFELAEKAIKAAGLLAVVGYLSLRAHWNQLGIPVVTGVETQRFIAEFYVLFTDVLFRLEVYAILVGVVGLICGFLWRLTPLEGVRNRVFVYANRLEKRSSYYTAPAILLALLLSLLFLLLHRMTYLLAITGGQPEAVGKLQPVASLRALGNQLFDNLLVLVIVSAVASWLIPKVWKRTSSLVWIWYVCRTLVVILALHLPILYGSFVRDGRYPRVSWTLDDQGPRCGLLILQTAESLSVWTADQGHGRIIVLPGKSEKTKLVLGKPEDLFTEVDIAAKREANPNLCPAQDE